MWSGCLRALPVLSVAEGSERSAPRVSPHNSILDFRFWIVGSGLNYKSERMELRIFDADHLSDGPLTTATLPYALPMGLHAKFV